MKIFNSILFSLLAFASVGQLQTAANQTALQLVQNVLLGKGVVVSNIKFSGANQAIGTFNSQFANVGLTSGIVMTTGTVLNNGAGPHGPNNQANAGEDNLALGSPLLATQAGGGAQTFNAATLEFDFIPYSDTVRFRYVFASEEYPEWSGDDFNDIFGFFISGPGITGQKNIAIVPGTQDVVSINNINNGKQNTGPCVNCSFYVNNSTQDNDPRKVQYDGLTKVLEAISKVQCGETYHLVMAIADVGDAIYDSGIFLEANSLSSETPVDINYTLTSQAFSSPNILAESCVSATVTIEREGDLDQPFNIPLSKSGSAVENVDYTSIPDMISFASGESFASFTFDALQDGLAEGQESLILSFDLVDPCGNQRPIVLNLAINDVLPVDLILSDTNVFCSGDEVEIIPQEIGGVPPYTYNWSNGESTRTIKVSPSVTSTYSLTITDDCLNESATDDITVTVPVYDPIVLDITEDITEICPFLRDTLEVIASGGAGNYSYQWFEEEDLLIGIFNKQAIQPSKSTTYKVLVTDQCGIKDSAYHTYTITSPPLLLEMSPEQTICPYQETFISVTATGGFGDYYYKWSRTGDDSSHITIYPRNTTYYPVVVSDDCQTFVVRDSVKITVVKPDADFFVSSKTVFENLPITFKNVTIGAILYEWDFGDGNSSDRVHPNNTFERPGEYLVELIATDEIGCKDTVQKPINILEEVYLYIPNTFTPDNNQFNGTFKMSSIGVTQVEIEIFDRWGELIFYSEDVNFEWDGTNRRNKIAPRGVYTYSIKYQTIYDENQIKHGHIVLLK